MSKEKKKKGSNPLAFYGETFVKGDLLTKLSFIIMGLSNLLRGQIVKGLIYLSMEFGFIFYMGVFGASAVASLRTLGTKKQGMAFDATLGYDVMQKGDNSMLLLLYGVLSVIIIILFIIMWCKNIHAAYESQLLKEKGERLPNFIDDIKEHFDAKLHKTMLFFPMLGILIFTIAPIIFMILMAFTNFDKDHQVPGNLFTWVGFENFRTMLFSGETIAKTFWPVLGWTIIWAIFATALNYIFGMLLAMLINRKGVRCKGLFRTIFVISIAVPSFVSLLIVRNMLNDDGPINVLLANLHIIKDAQHGIHFLSEPLLARITVIVVNLWVGIPYTMLITTGILMNIPEDLYESAKIDGARPATMYFKITLPYMLFVTGPYLITQFIGNINNFNVIYFLTNGNPATLDYYQAGKTDLLVTWLYKLTVNWKDYSYASTIGVLVFIVSAIFALISYNFTSANRNEGDFS
ncbi:carbohydrate ABC transporter permease [Anaeromicropila herbilytica]|uniref:Maltose/maltodextrin transport system permease protein n=1 Tax=Anaeromicropila herbilytica TaxID=2785025 RepID=A0A7R7EQL2_9FIRM|nr:sugar ABC transporter permease [Anaeromicropila herbilytica]BCN32945.1 sugar ABC transporter permease [Anaeromicropila herbilytica]